MKRALLNFLVLAIAIVATGDAFAGYCVVTKESDTATNEPSSKNVTLRGVVELDVNTSSSSCTMYYFDSSSHSYKMTNDYEHFSQGVLFDTNASGVNVSSYLVDQITFSKTLTVDASNDIVIGNPSLDAITDSSSEVSAAKNGVDGYYTDDFLVDAGIMTASEGYKFYGYDETFVQTYFEADWDDGASTLADYGTVLIDASSLGADVKPFACKDEDSATVYLRNLVIITNDVTESDLFDGGCVKNGGNAQVCTSAQWTGDLPSENSRWCPRTSGDLPFNNSDKYPGKDITPGNGGDDDDCEDEDKSTWYQDSDSDGYGNPAVTTEDCDQPTGYVADGSDCDDADPSIHPAAAEDCSDTSGTVDNDCDNTSGCSDATCDSDNACNGVGAESDCDDSSDNDGDGETDCDDSDCASDSVCYSPITPAPSLGDDSETECEDNIDDDSDGSIDCDDSDCSADAACAETDADSDGFTPAGGDCDDSNGDVNPGESEICSDLIDNNCNGVTDETDSCVDTSVGEGDGATIEAIGSSAGGCGCDLRSQSANTQGSLAMLLTLLPAFVAGWLRAKAAHRENQI